MTSQTGASAVADRYREIFLGIPGSIVDLTNRAAAGRIMFVSDHLAENA
jgi:hypothetical protein